MPAFVGLAVNVTFAAAQTVNEGVEILTDGVTEGLTVIVIALDPILLEEGQTAFEVNTQVTTSLFAKVFDVKVVEFVPVFVPFTFH